MPYTDDINKIFSKELRVARKLLAHEQGLLKKQEGEAPRSTRRSICKQLEGRLASLLASREELAEAGAVADRINCSNCGASTPAACGCFVFHPVQTRVPETGRRHSTC